VNSNRPEADKNGGGIVIGLAKDLIFIDLSEMLTEM